MIVPKAPNVIAICRRRHHRAEGATIFCNVQRENEHEHMFDFDFVVQFRFFYAIVNVLCFDKARI